MNQAEKLLDEILMASEQAGPMKSARRCMLEVLERGLAEQPAQQDSPWCMKMNGCKTKCEDCPDEAPKQPAQTEAARLADELENTPFESTRYEAAAELRRLVSFNQQLMDEVARLNKAVADEPEIVQRVKRYAGETLRTARNPNITARECIELANWLAAHGITK